MSRKTAAYLRSAIKDKKMIARQLESIKKVCGRYRLAKYVDEGWASTDQYRPALNQLLADARGGKIHTLYVTDINRLSRNFFHLQKILKELKGKVNLRTVNQPSDTLTLNILTSVAGYERNQIAKRLREAKMLSKNRKKK